MGSHSLLKSLEKKWQPSYSDWAIPWAEERNLKIFWSVGLQESASGKQPQQHKTQKQKFT